MRALELLTGMVTRRNLMDLVKKLMENVDTAEGTYKNELVSKIIYICSRDKFAFLTDAGWYVNILASLSQVQGSSHGELIALQLVDLTVRVESVRPLAVAALLPMLKDKSALSGHKRGTMEEVLYAAAWIVGEYAEYVPESVEDDDDDEEDTPEDRELYNDVIMTLLDKRNLALPAHVQAVYIQSILKVLSALVSSMVESVKSGDMDGEVANESVLETSENISESLPAFVDSFHVEVQERASSTQHILHSLQLVKVKTADVAVVAAPTPESGEEGKEANLLGGMSADLMDITMSGGGSGSGSMFDLVQLDDALKGLFEEVLKPVHPEAQVPFEGLLEGIRREREILKG
jgi:AP-3 complex subunit delta-1